MEQASRARPKTKRLSGYAGEQPAGSSYRFAATNLVRATGEQRHQHHQVRDRKQPLIRLNSRAFRSPGDETQVPALREVAKVVDTDPSQAGDLGIGEYFLARFDRNHGFGPFFY